MRPIENLPFRLLEDGQIDCNLHDSHLLGIDVRDGLRFILRLLSDDVVSLILENSKATVHGSGIVLPLIVNCIHLLEDGPTKEWRLSVTPSYGDPIEVHMRGAPKMRVELEHRA